MVSLYIMQIHSTITLMHRRADGKLETIIYNYVAIELPMLKRMFDRKSMSTK